MKEIFLSYSHNDRILAHEIKRYLEEIDFACFLAHEEIEVTAVWRDEIRKHLDSCSGLIAIVTQNFAASAWTNQEVGIILGKEKPVVPLIFGDSTALPAFIEAIQGIPVSVNTVGESVAKATPVFSQESVSFDSLRANRNLASILTKFNVKWERYQRLPENERWLASEYGGSYEGILNAAAETAEALVEVLATDRKYFEPSTLNQIQVAFDQLERFARSRIMVVGRSDWEEMEKRGETAAYTINALLSSLKSK